MVSVSQLNFYDSGVSINMMFNCVEYPVIVVCTYHKSKCKYTESDTDILGSTIEDCNDNNCVVHANIGSSVPFPSNRDKSGCVMTRASIILQLASNPRSFPSHYQNTFCVIICIYIYIYVYITVR